MALHKDIKEHSRPVLNNIKYTQFNLRQNLVNYEFLNDFMLIVDDVQSTPREMEDTCNPILGYIQLTIDYLMSAIRSLNDSGWVKLYIPPWDYMYILPNTTWLLYFHDNCAFTLSLLSPLKDTLKSKYTYELNEYSSKISSFKQSNSSPSRLILLPAEIGAIFDGISVVGRCHSRSCRDYSEDNRYRNTAI